MGRCRLREALRGHAGAVTEAYARRGGLPSTILKRAASRPIRTVSPARGIFVGMHSSRKKSLENQEASADVSEKISALLLRLAEVNVQMRYKLEMLGVDTTEYRITL